MNLTSLYLTSIAIIITGAIFLHLLPYFGEMGVKIGDFFCVAPGIDIILSYFMLFPLLLGTIVSQWNGVGVALVGEISGLWIWIFAHEWKHRKSPQKAKISTTLSQIFGKWRNHLAVWITALAIPVFWGVRLAEIVVYPPLTKLVNLPKYDAKEWVNVSRQKFQGLVGYDLIWCLYCDWMTGVWSLGTEMLRNVESFWCPIRFYSDKKCENCKIDFPDIEDGWVSADGTIEDVTKVLQTKYSITTNSSWFGHNDRKNRN